MWRQGKSSIILSEIHFIDQGEGEENTSWQQVALVTAPVILQDIPDTGQLCLGELLFT
jgi:hypothetical protein